MHPEYLGPFKILNVLGRGGLGIVYRALDERNEDEVAVKLLIGTSVDNNSRAVDRFLREFDSLSLLDHPNIVRVIDAGIDNELPFFSMELVEGINIKGHLDVFCGRFSGISSKKNGPSSGPGSGFTCIGSAARKIPEEDDYSDEDDIFSDSVSGAFDLNNWLEEADSDILLGKEVSDTSSEIGAIGPAPSVDLPFETAMLDEDEFDLSDNRCVSIELNNPIRITRIRELMIQISSALEYIHSRGIVHRDLKPSNILVDIDGDARLMDFGLCKTLSDITDITDSGHVVGTYRYMSPEQACNEPVDTRSDLYSLGIILYELLAGRPPFTAKNPVQLWQELLESEPEPISRVNPGVDRKLAFIVHALLRKDPMSRLQTAEEIHEALLE